MFTLTTAITALTTVVSIRRLGAMFYWSSTEQNFQVCTDYSNDSPNCAIKASPKSKAFAPGMARSICMDAGFLCDRAGLNGAMHKTFSNPTLHSKYKRQPLQSPPNIHHSEHQASNILESTPQNKKGAPICAPLKHPTHDYEVKRLTGAFFWRSHITVSRRCSAINANNRIPMAIFVHQELNVPSKLIHV